MLGEGREAVLWYSDFWLSWELILGSVGYNAGSGSKIMSSTSSAPSQLSNWSSSSSSESAMTRLGCFELLERVVRLDTAGNSATVLPAIGDLFALEGVRIFVECLDGDSRSDVYSSLFLFFPRFSWGASCGAAPSVHKRRGSPRSAVAEEGRKRLISPVRSMDSIASNGDVASLCSDLSGVAFGREFLEEDAGCSSRWGFPAIATHHH